MSSRTRTRHLAVVALSAALLLGACDDSGEDVASLNLTSPEEHTEGNTSHTPKEPEEPSLTSIPRVEEDQTVDRYLPPNAVLPDAGNSANPPAATTSSPDNGGENNSEDDGFPTATPTDVETTPSEPSERPESSRPSGESSKPSTPTLPSLPALPDRGVELPSGATSSNEATPEAPTSTEAPGASEITEKAPSGEPDEENGDSSVESAPTRSWVPVEPAEED